MLKIGQVVAIADDKKKRNQWLLAKVLEVKVGRDGKVRTVKVKTSNRGESIRTVRELCPLEHDVPDEILPTE